MALASAPAARCELEWVRPDWEGLRARRRCFVEALRDHWSARALTPAPLPKGEGSNPVGGGALSLGERAGVRVRELATPLLRALVIRSAAAVHGAARDLAGLGEGSTPAGDDYLVGVMYALRALLPAGQAGPLCAAIAEAATPMTTRLSGAWLQRASGGEAIPTWSFFLSSLAQGNHNATLAATERVLALGHTSGRAALAGFLDVCELLGDHDA